MSSGYTYSWKKANHSQALSLFSSCLSSFPPKDWKARTISSKTIILISIGSMANHYASLLLLYNKDSFISTSHSTFSLIPDTQHAFNKQETVLLLTFCSIHCPTYCYYQSEKNPVLICRNFTFLWNLYLSHIFNNDNGFYLRTLFFPIFLRYNDMHNTIHS